MTRQISATTGHRIGVRIPRHAPVIVAKEMLSPPIFAGLFKFAFVRNPWDRMVSAYAHFQREYSHEMQRQQISSFESFVTYLLETPPEQADRAPLVHALQRPQIDSLIGLHGELLVDFVGRYEHLQVDFTSVLRHIPLPHRELPHKRRSERESDYRKMFTDRLAEQVGQHFASDLSAFQYTFDDEAQFSRKRAAGGTFGGWPESDAVVPLRPRLWVEEN